MDSFYSFLLFGSGVVLGAFVRLLDPTWRRPGASRGVLERFGQRPVDLISVKAVANFKETNTPTQEPLGTPLRRSAMADMILSNLILSHPILSYPILSYPNPIPILSKSYPILSYPILSYPL